MRKLTKRLSLSAVAMVFAISTISMPAAWASSYGHQSPRDSWPPAIAPTAPPASELGTTVAEVAARHRLPQAELERRLKRDKRLRIGRGRLLFAEPAIREFAGTAESAAGATALGSLTAGTPTTSQAFSLHSLPGAKRVIYLDFDGHTLSGTVWGSKLAVGTAVRHRRQPVHVQRR